jgi:hypothetical protein
MCWNAGDAAMLQAVVDKMKVTTPGQKIEIPIK